MPMIVEQAGFVISLSCDSPLAQGDDEWLENHSMYSAWWSIMEDVDVKTGGSRVGGPELCV